MHEKYRDMPDWRGQETADIVYEDCGPDHKLTAFLSRYLLPEHRLHERENIKYYLEVKTTTGDGGNRFFLSKAQYNRVRTCNPSMLNRPQADIHSVRWSEWP